MTRGRQATVQLDLSVLLPSVPSDDLRHTCASHLVQGTWTAEPLRLEGV